MYYLLKGKLKRKPSLNLTNKSIFIDENNEFEVIGESIKGFSIYEILQVDHYVYNTKTDLFSNLGTNIPTHREEALDTIKKYRIKKRIKKLKKCVKK